MIVTCNKCSTRFNLDDFLIKEDGSKVRCSVCQHIFTAYPISTITEPAPQEIRDSSLDSDAGSVDAFETASGLEMEDSDLSLEEADIDIQNSDFEIEETDLSLSEEETDSVDDDDFSFEEEEVEIKAADDSIEDETEDDVIDFEDASDSDVIEFEDSAEDDDTIDFQDDDDKFTFDIDAEDDEGGFEFEDISEEEDTGVIPVTKKESSDIDFEDPSDDDFDSIEFESIDDTMDDTDAVSLELEDEPAALEMEDDNPLVEPIDDDTADEDEFELEFDVDDDDVQDDTISQKSALETSTLHDPADTPLSLESSREDEPPVITPEHDFSEFDEALDQETEPDDDLIEEETVDIDDLPEKEPIIEPEPAPKIRPRTRRREKKPLVGAPVLILLLIFFLVIGAYVASIMTGYKIPYLSDIKIPFIEQFIKKPAPEVSDIKPVPNQKSVNGRFVTNASAGTLFVITGRVDNPSNSEISHIQVRGALITKGKEEAKTKNTYCGNIITEEMLKTGNISDINALLGVKAGMHDSNVNIKPNASVPFMVVFSNLPEKLQNFTVKVTEFDKPGNSK